MGRKPKSDKVKQLEGNYRKSRDGKPAKPVGIQLAKPSPPSWLNQEAKNIFNELVSDLYDLGIVSPGDRYKLSVLAAEYQEYIQCQREISKFGLTIQETDTAGNQRTKKNPACELAMTKSRMVSQLLSDFGLNPTDRAKVSTIEDGREASGDPLEDHLNQ
jgi:P27 family predicted phage terminase small subunit